MAGGVSLGWELLPIGSCMAALIDYRGKSPRKVSSGIPLITARVVKGGRILTPDEYIAEADYEEWMRRGIPEAGDILLTTEAPLGEVAQLDGRKVALAQRLITLRGKSGVMDNRFLKFAMQSDFVQSQLRARATGTTVHGIRQSELRKVQLPVPHISEQKAIARVLGMLDDKIALGQRMNATLEAMARAIFRSWFLDFDPVRAKAEGRQPFGMETETVALFPDSFQESSLGKIPKGWNVGPILARAKLLSGGTPKTDRKEYWNGGILWASAKDVSQSRETFLIETERTISECGLAESATQLIPRFCTVIVARGATTGRMAILGSEMAMNQTCYALAATANTPFFLYCLLQHEVGQLVHAAHGSVFDTITTDTFARSRVVLPPERVVEAFEMQVGPLFQRILANTIESSALASTRDLLLPKLISGEIRVNHEEISSGGTR